MVDIRGGMYYPLCPEEEEEQQLSRIIDLAKNKFKRGQKDYGPICAFWNFKMLLNAMNNTSLNSFFF